MPDAPPLPAKTVDERRLRKLLTSRKSADKAELEAWLAFMQPFDAAPLLAEIAKEARSPVETRTILLRASLIILVYSVFLTITVPLLFGESATPAAYMGISGMLPLLVTHVQARSGREAALLLARTGDTRAVQLLAKLWMPRPLTRREVAFNADVSRELTRLLSARQGDRYDLTTEKVLRELLERAFPAPSKMPPLFRYMTQRRADLTEADTDLLLGVVRHLSYSCQVAAATDVEANDAAVRRVAVTAETFAAGENRALLRDTAQTLLVGRGTSV